MVRDVFSNINFPSNSTLEYLSTVNFKDHVDVSNRKMYFIAVFVTSILTNPLNNDFITINDSLKYVGERRIVSQEIHLTKTAKALDFLRENWDLNILISRAEIKIKDYFGLTPLHLETLGDDELVLSIITEKSPEEALEKLSQFDRDWWIENEKLAKGKLCIDVVPK